MNWKQLTHPNQLAEIDELSQSKTVLIFKHSTRCSISSMVLNRLQRDWDVDRTLDLEPYMLSLIEHREASNAVAQHYGIVHESPQALLIRDGACFYDASHNGISFATLLGQLPNFSAETLS